MRRTTILLAAALLLGGGAVGCSKSYDEIVNDCVTALKERAKGDTGKPDACKDVKDDDYTALVVNQRIDDLGWTDEDGKFDKNKMLDDVLEDEQP